MALNIAIVEDEEKSRNTLQEYLDRFGEENNINFLVDSFDTPVMLLDNYLSKYDIIYLDIKMPDMDGMEAARRIRAIDTKVILIFVTSLTQYAVAGYEVEALDYIVKPVQYYNFALKLTRALRRVNSEPADSISITTGVGIARINLRDIRYAEVKDHLLTYYTFDGTYSEFRTITNLEQLLKDKGFARCSNYCLVNLRYVFRIKGYSLYLNDGTELHISQPRKRSFQDAVNAFREK